MHYRSRLLLFFLAFVCGFGLFFSPAQPAMAALPGWTDTHTLLISNPGGAKTNYQVLVTLDTASLVSAGRMLASGDDIRFGVDPTGSTLFNYFIDSGMNTASTHIWVQVPSIPAGDSQFYLFNGNVATTAASDFAATFPTSYVLSSGSATLTGVQTYDWFEVANGATLNVGASQVFDVSARVIRIAGTINANAAGYAAGPNNGNGPGAGRSSGGFNGGSAGYGGNGRSAVIGGSSYGTSSGADIDMGSSGATGWSYPANRGGAGGGGVRLVAGEVLLTGMIQANGQNGFASSSATFGGGGGSGGGILINADRMSLAGATLQADGGGAGNIYGFTGAGGRIKLFAATPISGSYTATANSTNQSNYGTITNPTSQGDNGTVFAGTASANEPTVKLPPATLSPATTTIPSGGSIPMTITIPDVQGSNTDIALSSSNPAIAAVPASVTIPAGQTSASFSVSGIAAGGPVTITATPPASVADPATATVNVTIGVTLTPANNAIRVGGTQSLTVAIFQAQPTITTVTLNSAASGTVSVPPSVNILAGDTSATFNATGFAFGGPVLVTATLPGGVGGGSASANVSVIGITLTPANTSIPIGGIQKVIVAISQVQPTATTVTLSSADSATVSVPVSVDIPANSTSATFNATSMAIGGPIAITATLPAGLGAGSATADVTVQSVGVSLTPPGSTITVGTNTTLTVSINQPQSSATTVTLSSSAPGMVSVPPSVDIPANSTSATFNATGVTVGGPIAMTATLPAGLGGGSANADVSVSTVGVTLTPANNAIRVGGTQSLMVEISQAQPTDTTVTLSSAASGTVSVPASVDIPANSTSATFNATGVAVGGPVLVTATLPDGVGGGSASANVSVIGLTLTPANTSIPLGGNQTLTVAISQAQPTATTVTLSSADSATVSAPVSVIIPANSTSATFSATSVVIGGPIAITATLPAGLGGGSANANVTVQSVGVSMSPAAFTVTASTQASLTVHITQVQQIDTVIDLTSSAPGVVAVPTTITILAGDTSAQFLVSGVVVGGPATITATLPAALGSSAGTLHVTVSTIAFELSPGESHVAIGGTATITIHLSPTQPNDVVVDLSSAAPQTVAVPASVTVPAGQSTFSFQATGAANGGPVLITGALPNSLGTITAATNVTVLGVELSPSSNTVGVGAQTPLTVRISAAQVADTIVTLSSATPESVAVPVSVTIPAGQTSATFSATGVATSSPVVVTATLPANLGGGSHTATVTVPSVGISLTTATTRVRAGGTTPLQVQIGSPQAIATVVTLTSAAPGIIAVPATVTIPVGQTSATFPATDLGAGGPIEISATLPPAFGGASANVQLTSIYQVALPLIISAGSPDLVTSISISPNQQSFTAGTPVVVNVTVTNQGKVSAGPFWVDLYINPSTPPTSANLRWSEICKLNPCFGGAWLVSKQLQPGQSITLSSSDFQADYAYWLGWFASGTTDIYAYADSWNPGIAAGAVVESNENNNRAERHGLTVIGANPFFAQPATMLDQRTDRGQGTR